MSHEERLPECKEIQCELKETINRHLAESVPVRSDVEKHNHQIKTLEEARLSTMEDIKEIKAGMAELKEYQKDLGASVKIWVLSGIVGTVMAFAIPTMMLFYNAGQMSKQLEITVQQVKDLK